MRQNYGIQRIKGKNVDEAITNACIDLGIEAAKLEYEVIEKGSNGFLGIGSKPAIIKAKKNQSVEDIAREFLPLYSLNSIILPQSLFIFHYVC